MVTWTDVEGAEAEVRVEEKVDYVEGGLCF